MTYKVNAAGTAAVSTDTYWLPIDEHTPRGVNCFLIARHVQGIATTGKVAFDEKFYTHWYPALKFQPPGDSEKQS